MQATTALVLLALAVGCLIGMVALDFAQRRNDRLAIATHKDELKEQAAKLAALHNESAEKFRQVADKVQAIEFGMTRKK